LFLPGRRIQARLKDIIKATVVKFIRRRTVGGRRWCGERKISCPMQEMGAQTQNGGPQFLVLY
jgi:hypothetical protein